jgi:hypothetical protein
MSLRNKVGSLVLAALLVIFWTVVRDRDGWSARPPAPAPTAVAPPPPVVAAVKPKKKTRRKAVAPKTIAKIETPLSPKKDRGARLREKGEALGGDSTEHKVEREERAAEKSDQ